MTEQELRSLFFAKTGLVATQATIDYQLFIWGFEEGRRVTRKKCADLCEQMTLYTGYDCAEAIRAMKEPE